MLVRVGWGPLMVWSQNGPGCKCFLVLTLNTAELMRRLLCRFMHGRINPSPPPPPRARASCRCPLTPLLFPLYLRYVRCCHLQVPMLSMQQASHSARIKIKNLRHRLSYGMNSLTGSRVGRFQSSEESYLTIKNILMGIFCVKLTYTQEKWVRTISSVIFIFACLL